MTENGSLAELAADDDVADTSDDQTAPVVTIPPLIQIPLLLLAALGLVTWITHHGKDAEPPVADLTTIAWLALLALASVLHLVKRVGFPGGAGFDLRLERERKSTSEAQDAAVDLQESSEDYASQLESWTKAAAIFNEDVQARGTNAESVSQIVARFCLERMEETRDLIALPEERVRVSLFWYFKSLGGLQLLLSNDVRDEKTLTYIFKLGEGLLGQSFIENRLYNLADARKAAYYVPITDEAEQGYHGLLLIPVSRLNGGAFGIVSIDREYAEAFDAKSENIGRALADLIALAWAHPTTRRYVPDVSAPS
ncbi:MAG TPA: hypothetical protein VGD50_08320 [Candidatus Baltobacteraceae bacterium]